MQLIINNSNAIKVTANSKSLV